MTKAPPPPPITVDVVMPEHPGRAYQRRRRRNRPPQHQRPGAISGAQEMDLWLGAASHRPPVFADDRLRRRAWAQNRARLMLLVGGNGRRPQAWWCYEAPRGLRYPGHAREQSVLFEAGLLTEVERNELLEFWRREFDRTYSASFFFCEGPGRILQGESGRAAHFAWADIPASLIEAWTAERVRSAAQIRALEAEASGAGSEPGAFRASGPA